MKKLMFVLLIALVAGCDNSYRDFNDVKGLFSPTADVYELGYQEWLVKDGTNTYHVLYPRSAWETVKPLFGSAPYQKGKS